MRTDYILDENLSHVYACLTPANRLVCQVMEHTGLRVSDALSLRSDKLARRMTVRESKTGKARRVSIPPGLLSQLEAQAGRTWVFEGRLDPDKHRTRQAVWADLKRAKRAFRIRANMAPHSLRKVYAVRLYRRYGDLDRVRRILGHDNPEVTMIYALADILTIRQELTFCGLSTQRKNA